MKIRTFFILATGISGLILTPKSLVAAGSLTPPASAFNAFGPVPTMLSLTEVEPRTPVEPAYTPSGGSAEYLITQSGSYYLTSNVLAVAGLHGINISASDVTLDLEGFSVIGSSSGLDGIYIHAGYDNITVRNGNISGWLNTSSYGNGVESYADNVTLEDLNVSTNNTDGITVSGSGTVRHCNVRGNGYSGIFAASNCIIAGCNASGNVVNGIAGGNGCTVSGCHADGYFSSGIVLSNNTLVADCNVTGNLSFNGITVGNNCLISHCVANGNMFGTGIAGGFVCKVVDCVAASNTNGISVSDHSQVTGCHVNNNTVKGISVTSFGLVRDNMVDFQKVSTTTPGIYVSGSGNRIEANNITRCGIGLEVASTENLILRNSVTFSTGVAYSIAAGNSVGVIVVPNSSSAINGSSGGGIGSTDPTANFAY